MLMQPKPSQRLPSSPSSPAERPPWQHVPEPPSEPQGEIRVLPLGCSSAGLVINTAKVQTRRSLRQEGAVSPDRASQEPSALCK